MLQSSRINCIRGFNLKASGSEHPFPVSQVICGRTCSLVVQCVRTTECCPPYPYNSRGMFCNPKEWLRFQYSKVWVHSSLDFWQVALISVMTFWLQYFPNNWPRTSLQIKKVGRELENLICLFWVSHLKYLKWTSTLIYHLSWYFSSSSRSSLKPPEILRSWNIGAVRMCREKSISLCIHCKNQEEKSGLLMTS